MKTRTVPLNAKTYITTAGQLRLGPLIDDAVERLAEIRFNGVGNQRKRSRGVVYRSFCGVLVQAGFEECKAHNIWREQVVALEELAINAEEQ